MAHKAVVYFVRTDNKQHPFHLEARYTGGKVLYSANRSSKEEITDIVKDIQECPSAYGF